MWKSEVSINTEKTKGKELLREGRVGNRDPLSARSQKRGGKEATTSLKSRCRKAKRRVSQGKQGGRIMPGILKEKRREKKGPGRHREAPAKEKKGTR